MVFKFNISDKGKAWKAEGESVSLFGKTIGDKINGKEIKPELDGYELEITGASDTSGFPLSSAVEGQGLKRVLLTRGFNMRNRTSGLRLRKTVRGKLISDTTSQINMKVVKAGSKKLEEVFSEQNQSKIVEAKTEAPKAEEKKAEAPKAEKPAEKKEEGKAEENKVEAGAEEKK